MSYSFAITALFLYFSFVGQIFISHGEFREEKLDRLVVGGNGVRDQTITGLIPGRGSVCVCVLGGGGGEGGDLFHLVIYFDFDSAM